MALWHTVLLIPHLFRLGSGAGVPSVPTHEPNFHNSFFDKTTVQDGILTKNNFDAGNNNDIDNKMPKQYDPNFYDSTRPWFLGDDVYTVLHSLVFQGQTGHHDFPLIFTTAPTLIFMDDEFKPPKPQQGLLERHQCSTSASW